MNLYTFSDAQRCLAALLEEALAGQRVVIRRKDGRLFELRPTSAKGSPLDVDTVALDVSTEEIVGFIQEHRRET